MAKREILILGGGFAGVYTALYLEKALRPEEASISLVNRTLVQIRFSPANLDSM